MQLAQDNSKMLSNIEVSSKQFSIKDMSLVMTILTKMYSKPIQTITQEYISNARDAHREVRQSKRIQVVAPTRFDPIMRIRDFGPGLSPDRIENVFLFYGSSTKRQTNTQTGGFGIGAKSAWAYTDSFTIISYHEGIKRTYIAHKSGGNGNLDLVSTEETTEHNGTCIQIAVNPIDVQKFKRAILRATFFWNEKEKPEFKGFDAQDLAGYDLKPEMDQFKEVKIYSRFPEFLESSDRYVAVIDGIPYPIRTHLEKSNHLIRQSYALILNTGEVNIAPNREEFIADDTSVAFFNKLDNTINTKITNYINNTIASFGSLKDGLKQYILLYKKFVFTGTYKDYVINYNGISIIDTKSLSYNNQLELGHTWELYRHKYRKASMSAISLDKFDHVYYDDMPFEAATKKVWRVKKMINAGKDRYFYLLANDKKDIATDIDAKMLSSIDASDYTVQRQAKAAIKKQEICLHYYERGLSPTQVNLSDLDNTIVYASLTDTDVKSVYMQRNSSAIHSVISYINSLDGMRFAFVADSSVSKIKNNKAFIHYDDFVKDYQVSDKQLKYYLKQKQKEVKDTENLEYLKGIKDKLKDPAIKYFIDLLDFAPGNTVSSCMPDCFYNKDHKLVAEFVEMNERAKEFTKKYPLLDGILSYSERLKNNEYCKNDAISYLNRKYREISK